jgi:meso-butanediol dehydrogenase/(S,S)-butanediol dehydrogenase/diacetyl reductase
MKLKGKVAIVSGGGIGIGKGIVKKLAEVGCNVAVADIDKTNAERVAKEIRDMGVKAISVSVDVTNWEEVQYVIKKTVYELGGLDIAVNNAGVISIKPVEELTE